ncbi:MAG: hypothetical protein RL168_499 [Bacteroidota bacterium]
MDEWLAVFGGPIDASAALPANDAKSAFGLDGIGLDAFECTPAAIVHHFNVGNSLSLLLRVDPFLLGEMEGF